VLEWSSSETRRQHVGQGRDRGEVGPAHCQGRAQRQRRYALTVWTIILVACSDLPWWVVLVALMLEHEYD